MPNPNRSESTGQKPTGHDPTGHEPTAYENAFLIGYAIARARPKYLGQVLRGVLRASNEINEAATDADPMRHGDCAVKPSHVSAYIECVPSGRGGYDHE